MKPPCTTAACANLSRYKSAGKCGQCYCRYHRANSDKSRKYMARAKETRELDGDVTAADDRESTDFELYKSALAAIVVKLKKATFRQINDRIAKECVKAGAPNRERWLLCALESLQSGEVLWLDEKHSQISFYRAGREPDNRHGAKRI